MAKLIYKNGITSVILRIKIMDSSSTTGAAKTGLTSASSGLIIATIADNEATSTAYTGSNLESITTLGTFAAPTSGKARFKEIDATNHPGLYEIQIADARWAVSNARSVIITVSGVTNAAQVDAEVQLESVPVNSNDIADGVLARNVAGGSSTGRTVAQALAKLRNKWDIYDNAGTPTMRVYATNDTTVLWEEALSTDAYTSDIVTGADPS